MSGICSSVFFFQAEDGIRDLVRSRGLGDVYKRQARSGSDLLAGVGPPGGPVTERGSRAGAPVGGAQGHHRAVSYTHLTLPTSDLV